MTYLDFEPYLNNFDRVQLYLDAFIKDVIRTDFMAPLHIYHDGYTENTPPQDSECYGQIGD